jgi:hypothetical protein
VVWVLLVAVVSIMAFVLNPGYERWAFGVRKRRKVIRRLLPGRVCRRNSALRKQIRRVLHLT